jgi:regulator of replication initiation timing
MTAVMEQVFNTTARAPEELHSLQAQQNRLLVLIAELLEDNEKLRMKLAQLEAHKEDEHGTR